MRIKFSQTETINEIGEVFLLVKNTCYAVLFCIQIAFLKSCIILFDINFPSYQAIKRARDLHNVSVAPPTVLPEYKLWEEHWCRCSHELGQWDTLNEFGKAQNGANPFLGQ